MFLSLKGRLRRAAAALSLLAGTAAVSLSAGPAPAQDGSAPAEPAVTIGALYDLSGSQSGLDRPSANGAMLAVQQANDSGEGVLGRKVALTVVDGHSQEDMVSRGASYLISSFPDLVGIIGLSDTDMALAAAPIAAEAGLPYLTSGATAPSLPGAARTLFLACFGDNVQAALAAEWLYGTQEARTVAILTDPRSTYTRLLSGYFTTRFTELGGTVASSQDAESAKQADVVATALAARPDAVFLSANVPEDAISLITALRDGGFSGPIIGGDGLDFGEAWTARPDIAEVYFTTHADVSAESQDPRIKAFRRAYRAAFPGETPSAFSALGYDAAGLLMDAVRRAGSTEPAAVLDALAATRDYPGLSGSISFDAGSRIPRKAVTILEIVDGHSTFVVQEVPKGIPAP